MIAEELQEGDETSRSVFVAMPFLPSPFVMWETLLKYDFYVEAVALERLQSETLPYSFQCTFTLPEARKDGPICPG